MEEMNTKNEDELEMEKDRQLSVVTFERSFITADMDVAKMRGNFCEVAKMGRKV